MSPAVACLEPPGRDREMADFTAKKRNNIEHVRALRGFVPRAVAALQQLCLAAAGARTSPAAVALDLFFCMAFHFME
eukprot:674159-Pyramimonas_sp.AAC.1